MSKETKQTAVEWLKQQLENYGDPYYCHISWGNFDSLIKQAKKIEKEQISNAFLKGYDYCNSRDLEEQDDDFEFDFYNETYGGNK